MSENPAITPHPGSFHDPSGSVYYINGVLFRSVNPSYAVHFNHFLSSGLRDTLIRHGMIAGFEVASSTELPGNVPYKLLKPEMIPFISYPYEWCFSQLRGAALLTLSIQESALSHGMTLKDAKADNIQFLRGRPVHIDTLSFEIYEEGKTWAAYRQFCQHFLLPLALMSLRDVSAGKLAGNFSDGIPLSAGATLLGAKWLKKPSLFLHITLQAMLEAREHNSAHVFGKKRISKEELLRLFAHLKRLIASLPAPKPSSPWEHYNAALPYSPEQYALKQRLTRDLCRKLRPKTVWDLGAHDGVFSRIAADEGAQVIALENEHKLVEKNYADGNANILPLWMDILNPTPAQGWAHGERASLAARGPADLLMALALSHHLAIRGSIPFTRQADYFSALAQHLLIEFISPDDEKARTLLSAQPSLNEHYTTREFEAAFAKHFDVLQRSDVIPGKRILYLMKRRG